MHSKQVYEFFDLPYYRKSTLHEIKVLEINGKTTFE